MALGSLAEDDRRTPNSDLAERYAQPALSMLPSIISNDDLVAVQCFILIRYDSTNFIIANF
jgi:hypothetical protein